MTKLRWARAKSTMKKKSQSTRQVLVASRKTLLSQMKARKVLEASKRTLWSPRTKKATRRRLKRLKSSLREAKGLTGEI